MVERMQERMLSLNDKKKVLTPINSVNGATHSSSITAIRCRCIQSRRITNILVDWERRNRKRMLRYREYKRLRDSVPSIARKNVSKLTIITEAASLIDRLELAVLNKFQSEGVPKYLRGIDLKSSSMDSELRIEDIKYLMSQLMSKQDMTKSKTKSTNI